MMFTLGGILEQSRKFAQKRAKIAILLRVNQKDLLSAYKSFKEEAKKIFPKECGKMILVFPNNAVDEKSTVEEKRNCLQELRWRLVMPYLISSSGTMYNTSSVSGVLIPNRTIQDCRQFNLKHFKIVLENIRKGAYITPAEAGDLFKSKRG